MKKFLAIMIAALMLISASGISVLADSFVVAGEEFEYFINSDGGYSITGYDGEAQILEIPAYIDGIPVTVIEDLYNDVAGYKVIIPETVKRIVGGALVCNTSITEIEVSEDNPYLCDVDGVLYDKDVTTIIYYPEGREDKSYTLPETVTELGEQSFHYAEIETLNISSSLKKINERAFYYAKNLTSVILPEGFEVIGDDAFFGCYGMTDIEIPDSVTTISYGAFYGCSRLKTIHIGSRVESFGFNVFEGCSSLESITVDSDNKVLSAVDGVLFSKDKTELIKYPSNKSDTSYAVPSAVMKIDNDAFQNVKYLENITFPDSLTQIDNEAFTECNALRSVTIPDSVTSLGFTFYNCDGLEKAYIGKNVTNGEVRSAFRECDSLKSIEVDPENQYISSKDGVLFNKDKTELLKFPKGLDMSSYKIPSTVRELGESAFNDQVGFSDNLWVDGAVYVDDCLLTFDNLHSENGNVCVRPGTRIIGRSAFWAESTVWGISLPDETEIICTEAFGVCNILQAVYIPAGVKYVGSYLFASSDMLSDIYYGGSEEQWNKIENIENARIPENVTIHFESQGNEFVNPVLPEDMYDNTYINEETGISVSTDTDAQLNADNITSEEIVASVSQLLPKAKVEAVYEINLEKEGEEIQPEDLVMVKIPTKNRFARVYRMEEDGSLTDMNAKYENGYLIFYTDHFSVYTLGMKQASEYELGDVDMNESINVKDATAVQKYIADVAEYQEDVVALLMDFDSNGSVNVKDATAIQKAVAGLK